MDIVIPVVAFGVVGLIFGSFLTSLTWRLPLKRKLLFKTHRSLCSRCKKPITWYDNIPLLSFVLLIGRCRHCKKSIPIRYPVIEITTGVLVALIGLSALGKLGLYVSGILQYYRVVIGLGKEETVLFGIFVVLILIAIAVIDIEHLIIPDELAYPFLLVVTLILVLKAPGSLLFIHFFWAALLSTFLLFLHWVTRGNGMGLGDVKLGFALGMLTGSNTPFLFLVAVLSGALVGIGMLLVGKAKIGHHIPFGPFLVFGALVILLAGHDVTLFVLGGR